MQRRSEPLRISLTLSPETVRSLFDFIAEATGTDIESRKAQRRMEVSQNAILAGEEPPADINLMVTKRQAAELLQISTRTIDNLKLEGRMPQPIRIGTAVRWNRAELVAWVDAGCPDCLDASSKSPIRRIGRLSPGSKVAKRNSRRRKADQLNPDESKQPAIRKKTPQPEPTVSRLKPPENKVNAWVKSEKRPSVFASFLRELGIDRNDLPEITNGELMRIAGVDTPTLHGWMHLGRDLPEEASSKLAEHFLGLVQKHE